MNLDRRPGRVLIPGSFDPIHRGHVDVVDQALELFGEVVVGVLYNREKPSGLFTPDERVALIEASLADRTNVSVVAHTGLAVEAAAECGAAMIVKGLRTGADFEIEQQMALMNHSVASVRTAFLPCHPEFSFVSSRFVREIAAHQGHVAHLVPDPVAKALADKFGDFS